VPVTAEYFHAGSQNTLDILALASSPWVTAVGGTSLVRIDSEDIVEILEK